jgi:hypothetical protein
MTATIASSVIVQSAGPTGNTASFSVPGGTASGDLGLIIVGIGTGQGSTFNTPSGWTELWQDNLNAGGTTGRWAAYWRTEPASPASVDVTWTSYARHYVGARYRITGHDATAPINATSALSSGSVASNASPPEFTIGGLTTTVDDCLLIAALCWQSGNFNATPYVVPSGWSATGLNHTSVSSGPRPSACAFQRTAASAGASGGVTIVAQNLFNPDSDARSWGGRFLAIAPSAAPPPAVGRSRIMWI